MADVGMPSSDSKTSVSSASSSSKSPAMQVEHKFTNKLIHEESPYLLQHAHNPVNWYPWGEEAFRLAREQNKPIFLSVGYSTCHWCHVMEHESFESEEIAAIMNKHFINIKVDREERPDVDTVYMTFIQALGDGGGWPMSVWLTPELKPFHGGTYFPPEDKYMRPGFPSVLKRIAGAWESGKERMLKSSTQIMKALQEGVAQTGHSTETFDSKSASAVFATVFHQFSERFDKTLGGFGSAPKFPRPSELNILFRIYYACRTSDPNRSKAALDMCTQSLTHMARGGVHDHVGGGFSRYSVDQFWHVPHFEKMMYDQAQLVNAYLDAYHITKNPLFKSVAMDILQYVMRDMTHPQGGVFSAEDADSLETFESKHKHEGAFYVWKKSEIDRIIGDQKKADVFNYVFYVKEGGNADLAPQSDPHDEFVGKNILIERHTHAAAAERFGMPEANVKDIIRESLQKLFQVREERPRPHLDDKIITSWNGMMMGAFARAHCILHVADEGDADDKKETSRYLPAAVRIYEFVRTSLLKGDQLLRSFRTGPSKSFGYCDDYAHMIGGLLDLYEASFDHKYLQWALDLQAKQDALFGDYSPTGTGGYFDTSGNDSTVLLRRKNDYDGAEPSANSIAALNLLRLGEISYNDEYRAKAMKIFSLFHERLSKFPVALPQLSVALDFAVGKAKHVVLVGSQNKTDLKDLFRAVHSKYAPNKAVVVLTEDSTAFFSQLNDFYSTLMVKDQATAYVCYNMTCQKPASSADEMLAQLEA